MKSKNYSLIFIFILFCLITSVYVRAQEDDLEPKTSIVLADIDDNPVKIIERTQPIADYLAAHLGEFGIETGEVKVAPDMETMIDWLAEGEVDILFDSPYPSMVMMDESGAIPSLRRWKDGIDVYHSVFFTLDDSGIESLEDLEGQMVAFDTIQSTSGYMLPKAHLMEMDYQLDEKARVTSRVRPDEIGYVFSSDDETTIQWVISGRVAAGVVDNIAFEEIPEESRQHFVILAETVDVPRNMMVVQPNIAPELLEAINEVLINMDEDEDAQEVLEAFNTTQFDAFPEGPDAAIEPLWEMFDMVQE
jgi:phosphonate transport system substrate-binding protein